MDINYWIILLIFYLVSQWMRRRVRRTRARRALRPSPEEGEKEEAPREGGIPDWLKSLGFPVPDEEVEPPRAKHLREEIEALDKTGIFSRVPLSPAKESPPVSAWPGRERKGELSEDRARERVKQQVSGRRVSKEPRRDMLYAGSHLTDMIRKPENLRDVIVLREILGPPRGTKRHRYRLHF